LKIGPHLPKYIIKHQGDYFFGAQCISHYFAATSCVCYLWPFYGITSKPRGGKFLLQGLGCYTDKYVFILQCTLYSIMAYSVWYIETWVGGRSRSLTMAPIDRSYTTY